MHVRKKQAIKLYLRVSSLFSQLLTGLSLTCLPNAHSQKYTPINFLIVQRADNMNHAPDFIHVMTDSVKTLMETKDTGVRVTMLGCFQCNCLIF